MRFQMIVPMILIFMIVLAESRHRLPSLSGPGLPQRAQGRTFSLMIFLP